MLFFFLFSPPKPNTQNALVSALPYLVMWLISLAVCPISDFLINRHYISVSTGRKLFNSIGHWVPALTLIALPFMHGPTEAVTMLTIGIGFNGFTYCGYILNHMDLSPNFAGALMGLTNSLANIMSILGPITVGFILTETTDVAVSKSYLHTIFRACFCVVYLFWWLCILHASINPTLYRTEFRLFLFFSLSLPILL